MILQLQNTLKANQLQLFVRISTCFLIILFIHTAVSKLISFDSFQEAMHNQAVPRWMASLLIWTLPPVELATVLLLYFKRSRLIGFWCALILMGMFTGYITIVLSGLLGEMPCSCGGVFKSMGWATHLVFNLFFLLLSLLGIWAINRERGITGKH